MRHLLVAVFAVFIGAMGCSKGSSAGPTTSSASARATTQPSQGHAANNVKPGSYEDWCEEHKVPESLCTRCDPSLAAAFKATNDWCEEHGLPESQCTICHPELHIVRPPPP